MRRRRVTRLTALVASGLLTSGALAACGADTTEAPEPSVETQSSTPVTTSSTAVTSETTSETESTTTEEESTTSETTETTETTRTGAAGAADPAEQEKIDEVHEIFSPLAPDELFAQFDACSATELQGSYDCSGPNVGQFQFFDSASKATSTTQLLTELRSSRVVEDTGRKIVGWSTLGTTAVITVVDNEEGLVMQQMVSTDQVDPEDRIHELGLAANQDEPEESEHETESPEETPTSTIPRP